jgi:hypothetical protein
MKATAIAFGLLFSSVAAAQQGREQTDPLCTRGRPRPACNWFLITETGGNMRVAPERLGYRTKKAQFEVGAMHNSRGRSAIGVTAFGITNLDDETYLGIKPRYRRWLSRVLAVDVSAGPRWEMNSGGGGFLAAIGFSVGDWGGFTTQVDVARSRPFINHQVTWHVGLRLGSYLGSLGVLLVPVGTAAHGLANR